MTEDERLARERDTAQGRTEGRVDALEQWRREIRDDIGEMKKTQQIILARVNQRSGAERMGRFLFGVFLVVIGYFAPSLISKVHGP